MRTLIVGLLMAASGLDYDPGIVATKTDFETVLYAAFGLARNFGNRQSLGVALIVDDFTHHKTGFGGVELRYRDWVDTTNVAVEWQLGYSRPEYETVSPSRLTFEFRRFHGVRAGTALMLSKYGTVFVRGDLSNSGGKRHVGFFVGAGATSYTSIYAVMSVGLAMVALIYLFPPVT